jgi:hypothetical protein
MTKKIYAIPCVWTVMGKTFVEADSLEEAKRIALEAAPLPNNSNYLDDSFEIVDESEIKVFDSENSLMESDFMQSGDSIFRYTGHSWSIKIIVGTSGYAKRW